MSRELEIATPGRTLADRYEVDRVVGQGAYGRVFRALDNRTGQHVALKEFVRGGRASGSGFLRELGILFELSHPHILDCHTLLIRGPFRYLVYEFLEAGSLRDRLRVSGSSTRESVALLRQAIEGVAYAHEMGVIHRDLKPENVLLTRQSGELRAKVSDFGISTLLTSSARGNIGSPAYMAPEQFYDAYDLRVDVYALGVMLYEALCGSRPYYGSPGEIMYAQMHQPVQCPDWIPPRLRAVVLRAVSTDPEERFQSAGAFGAALDEAFAAESDQLENAGWPVQLENVSALHMTRDAVVALTSDKRLLRFDRRGRLGETVDEVDALVATEEHYLYQRGTSARLVLPRGRTRELEIPEGARLALSAEASVAVVSGGGATLHGLTGSVQAWDPGSDVTGACFVGADQGLAVQRSKHGKVAIEVSGNEFALPEPCCRLWGHTRRLEIVGRSARDPEQLYLIAPGTVREVRASVQELACDGDAFVGAGSSGDLVTIQVRSARVAKTTWESSLSHVAACRDGLAWATAAGSIVAMS